MSTATRDLVTIGQRWRRRRDGKEFRVHQVWRADRQVCLKGDDRALSESQVVGFTDLRRKWQMVDGGAS